MTSRTTVVGIEIAKRMFQLDWVERETGEIKGLKLARAKVLEHVAHRAPCLIAMEACGGAPHWGRPLQALGHPVKWLPAKQVRPFVRGNKNDAQEARAIGTAAHPPDLKEGAIKSEAPQAVLALPRRRRPLMTCRLAQRNCLRGLLAEDGEVRPNGYAGRRRGIAPALERVAPRLPALGVETLREPWARVSRLPTELTEIEGRLRAWHREDKASPRLAQSPGGGAVECPGGGGHEGRPEGLQVGA